MNAKFRWMIKVVSMLGLVVIAGCGIVPATGGSGAAVPTETLFPTPALPTADYTQISLATQISTAVVSGTAVSVFPGSTETAAPQATLGPGEQLVITLDSDNQTYHLKVGQRFLVNLGMDTFDWNVQIADQSVASLVIGVMVIRGAQGLYEARAPGTTTLTATGDPLCRQSKPACMMPSRVVRVTLVVEP